MYTFENLSAMETDFESYRENFTHFCKNLSLDCDSIFEEVKREIDSTWSSREIEEAVYPFLAKGWPLMILAIIAVLLNLSELIAMKIRRLKCSTSEYLIISLCVLDMAFSILTIVMLAVQIIEDENEYFQAELLLTITEQLQWFSVFGSIFHVLGISLERVFAVTFLMEYKVFVEKGRMKIYVFTIWILTLLLQGCIGLFLYRKGLEYGYDHLYFTAEQITGGIIFFVGFLICILNIFMVYKILKQSVLLHGIFVKNRRSSTGKRQSGMETLAFITCCLVSLGFLVFNFPFAAKLIIFKEASLKFEITAKCLLIANSIFNPLIYFWRGYWLRVQRRKSVKKCMNSSQAFETVLSTQSTPRTLRKIEQKPYVSPVLISDLPKYTTHF